MQTPGRQTEPQTPMIPMERRMDLAYDRLLQRATEEAENIERPQVRTLGRIINQMESMNLTMRGIQDQIRQDVRAKRRYYREEAKILKKDSDNLKGVQTNILSGLRGKGALVAGGIGAAQLSQGNVGGAVQSFGLASVLMAPEIIEFLTGSVVNVLALKGLIGNRGVGATNITRGIGGASKMRNPLLATAFLAASILLPSLAQAGQSGDNKRRELASKTIQGEQTINKPDVTRFRNQLNRFDRIISGINVDKKKKSEDSVNLEQFSKNEKLLEPKKDEEENKGFFEGIKNFFSFNKKNDKKVDENVKKDDKISLDIDNLIEDLSEGDTSIVLGDTIEGNTTIEGNNLEVDNSTKISLTTKLLENSVFTDQISNIFESNEDLATNLLPNLDIAQMGREIKSEISNNVIDLSTNQENKVPSGFVGQAVSPASVSVNTAFRTGGGIIDKFEAASSLRSYGAFS